MLPGDKQETVAPGGVVEGMAIVIFGCLLEIGRLIGDTGGNWSSIARAGTGAVAAVFAKISAPKRSAYIHTSFS